MAYIVNQDIIDRVGNTAALELTTDSGAVISQTVLDNVRTESEGQVDRWLSRRVATPVDTSVDATLAEDLKRLTLDIAEFRLRSRRPPVPEAPTRLYTDALKWLQAFVKGDVNLPGAVTPASTTSDNPTLKHGGEDASESRKWMY